MSRDDWYRGTDWDATAQADFEARLGRARSQRSQYLFIKGAALTESKERPVREAGRGLIHRMLEEGAGHPIDVIRAHHALGASYAREAQYSRASEHLEESLRLRDAGLSVVTWSDLELAELIIAAKWAHRFDEAIDWLNHYWAEEPPFPASNFRALLAEARIAILTQRSDRARKLAQEALDLLKKNQAPFPRHADVGIIKTDRRTIRELERLAR